MTELESCFKTLQEKACGPDVSETTSNILNHVLQHFWTLIVLAESHDLNEEHDFFTRLSASLSSNRHEGNVVN